MGFVAVSLPPEDPRRCERLIDTRPRRFIRPSGGYVRVMGISLHDIGELLGRSDETTERLGDELHGQLDVDVDAVDEVRDVRETV